MHDAIAIVTISFRSVTDTFVLTVDKNKFFVF